MADRILYFGVIWLICLVNSSTEWSIKSEVDYINSAQSLWKADYNSVSGFDINWKPKLGVKLITRKLSQLRKYFIRKFVSSKSKNDNSPEKYDVREAWPKCEVISSIKDQASCGSCWAVAGASMLSDRFCIASNTTIDRNLAAEDLMRCCSKCKVSDNGCDGGDIVETLMYMKDEGIVTGGDYGSEEGCLPYSFKPCSNSTNDKKRCVYGDEAKTEKCQKRCSNSKYKIQFKSDKYKSSEAFLMSSEEANIKKEIIKSGTLLATMDVREDFMYYKSGVYQHVAGKNLGGHVVRLLGWGNQNGIPYWFAANSWGRNWGENGTFKVHRTKSRCRFGKYILGSEISKLKGHP